MEFIRNSAVSMSIDEADMMKGENDDFCFDSRNKILLKLFSE
jgi:hypothetical protein